MRIVYTRVLCASAVGVARVARMMGQHARRRAPTHRAVGVAALVCSEGRWRVGKFSADLVYAYGVPICTRGALYIDPKVAHFSIYGSTPYSLSPSPHPGWRGHTVTHVLRQF
jgi:hypothetical protein